MRGPGNLETTSGSVAKLQWLSSDGQSFIMKNTVVFCSSTPSVQRRIILPIYEYSS